MAIRQMSYGAAGGCPTTARDDGSHRGEDDLEPLLGYVILEQAQAAVDMLGHRLVPVP